eukprot:5019974-Amphidinium_carterae.1
MEQSSGTEVALRLVAVTPGQMPLHRHSQCRLREHFRSFQRVPLILLLTRISAWSQLKMVNSTEAERGAGGLEGQTIEEG